MSEQANAPAPGGSATPQAPGAESQSQEFAGLDGLEAAVFGGESAGAPESDGPDAVFNEIASEVIREAVGAELAQGSDNGASQGSQEGAAGSQDGESPASADKNNTPPVEGAVYDEAAQQWRGPDGKFVAAGDAAAGAPAGGEPTPEPEAPKPALPFTVYGKDGQALTELPVGEIEFKADGKVRREPLEKVVRLAQMGFYNEKLQQEVEAARTEAPQLRHELSLLKQQNEQYAAFYEKVASDDEFVDAFRAEFARLHSPEARAERAEREVQDLREQERTKAAQSTVVEYTTTQLAPAFEALAAQYESVSFEEAYGRFSLLTQPLLVNGKLPPQRLDEVSRIVVEQIAPWMAQLHEHRVERASAARDAEARQRAAALEAEKQAAEARAREAQIKATEATKTAARVLQPAGGASADRPRAKPIESADDAVAALVGSLKSGH